jgi:hypothetical protein
VYLWGKGYPHVNNLQGNFPLHPFSTILPVKGENFAEETREGNCFPQGGSMQYNAILANVWKCIG